MIWYLIMNKLGERMNKLGTRMNNLGHKQYRVYKPCPNYMAIYFLHLEHIYYPIHYSFGPHIDSR